MDNISKKIHSMEIEPSDQIEKELRYQALVEQSGDAFIVHDFNGKFIEVNQRACDSLGYTKEELLTMSVTSIEQDFDLEKAQLEWTKIEPDKPFTLCGHQRRKNGEIFPVEVQFACFMWKEKRLYSGLIRDVSERQAVEDTLRKTQALLNKTQELSRVGGWEYDINTKLMSWTEEVYRIHGVTRSYDPNNVEQNIMFYHQDDQNRIAEAFRELTLYGEPYELELQLIQFNGEIILVRTLGQAEFKKGVVNRVFGYIMDINEGRKAKEALQKKLLACWLFMK